jgi:hypothetical protein
MIWRLNSLFHNTTVPLTWDYTAQGFSKSRQSYFTCGIDRVTKNRTTPSTDVAEYGLLGSDPVK